MTKRIVPLAFPAIGILASASAFAADFRVPSDSSDSGARAVPAGKEANAKAIAQAVADAVPPRQKPK